MKNIKYFSIMICFSFILGAVGCEKSTDQTQRVDENWPVTVRTILDECSDCPVGCCCCGIEAIDPPGFRIELCGLCEGDYLCGTFSPPNPPCSSVSGTGKDIIFIPFTHPREVFCVEPGSSFRIYNPNNFSVTFKFTCQYDVTPHTFITVTIPKFESKFFYNDGSCISADCN